MINKLNSNFTYDTHSEPNSDEAIDFGLGLIGSNLEERTYMRKAVLISAIIFFVTFLLTVTAWSDDNNACIRNIDGKTACPPVGGTCLKNMNGKIACSPPHGGIVKNKDGEMLCGPGKCMINGFAQAFCSSEQGGSITRNSSGEPVCTGSCVPASASACSWP
jgi:hypothetical protein